MRNAVIADRADRILRDCSRPVSAPARPKRRHGRVGAPHLWRMQRAFQIDFLQRMGLANQHQLLDLGCGTLRGGLPLIAYLSAGNYTGIDVRAEIIDEALRELEEAGLEKRYPRISHVESLAELDLRASLRLHLGVRRADAPRRSRPRGRARASRRAICAQTAASTRTSTSGDGRLGAWAGFPVVARPLDWYRARAHEAGLSADALGRLCALGHVSGDRNCDSQFMLRFRRAG